MPSPTLLHPTHQLWEAVETLEGGSSDIKALFEIGDLLSYRQN